MPTTFTYYSFGLCVNKNKTESINKNKMDMKYSEIGLA